jgi:hypothetical protein
MLAGYADALHAAGFRITGPTYGLVTVHPQAARQATPAHEPARTTDSKAGAVGQATPAPGRTGTGSDRQPRQPARGLAGHAQVGRTDAEPPDSAPEALLAGGEPGQPQAKRCPEPLGEGTTEGKAITPGHIPAHGENLRQGTGDSPKRHLATEADPQAGKAFRSGDIDRAYQLLTGAPDPERQQRVDQAETQAHHSVPKQEPRQVSPGTETGPCPQCGRSYVRPAGDASACLSCQTQARLEAAGFTADSPEIKQAAAWNHAVIRRGSRQPETPQRPEPNPPQPHPHSMTRPGALNAPEHEKEACG